MKPKSPLNITARAKASATPSTPTTVKKKLTRAQLQQAIRERQRLKAAEYYTQNPVKNSIQKRGQMVGRHIGMLQAQQKKG